MCLGRLVLMLSLLLPAAAWAQLGKSDVMKLATDRTDTIIKVLKLTPEQISVVKPLLESRLKEMSAVKKKYTSSDQNEDAKKTANESLKAISSKYDGRITSPLNPEQLKKWNDLSKGWKSIM